MTDQHYASDNYAGICPEAWAAMVEANAGHAVAYGDDVWTARAVAAVRELFATDCEVFFVFNGTAANALALAASCQPYHGIICSERAHVAVDESGAPGFFTGGASLLVVPGSDGKLTAADIGRTAAARSDVHFPKVRAATISQTTETGQVYTPAEVAAIGAACREHGLTLHMDGARFANACASLGCPPAALTWQAGVEVLCFGGTKNGMALGEALVFFDADLAREFAWRRKQAGQLASKMRFVAAPWVGMLEGGAWLRRARHGNDCAQRFAAAAGRLVMYPVEGNAVFLDLPPGAAAGLRARGWVFYTFAGNASRFMFGWDADVARVDALSADLAELVTGAAAAA